MNSAVLRQLSELQKEVKNRKDAKAVIDALDVTQQIGRAHV